MHSTIWAEWTSEWTANYFDLGLTLIDSALMKICAKNDFYIFVPSDLDLWPLELKFFNPLVTLVQRYVSIKSEVSAAFQFRENRRHKTDERTDRRRGATLMRLPTEDRNRRIINNPSIFTYHFRNRRQTGRFALANSRPIFIRNISTNQNLRFVVSSVSQRTRMISY